MNRPQETLMFDNLDLDLIVKVLSHTVFSPFFAFFVPVIYRSQGALWTSSIMVGSCIYVFLVSAFWFLKFASRLWRNGGSWLFSPERLDWGDQIVVITGGSSGIGALLANTLAIRSVSVVILDIKPLVTENSNITFYHCDISKWDQVEAVAKRIVADIGHPTILVNNAGVVQGKLITDLLPQDVQQTLDTNLLSHFWTLKAFLPEMIKEKKGHIITLSSVMGLVGCAQLTDYCASKAALISLHESLRYELDKRHKTPFIRTTLVLPGHIQTPLFSQTPSLKIHSSPFYRFFTPSLQPHVVVKAIIAAMDEQESRTIMLPFYANFVRIAGILPTYGRDFLQWLSGADYAMKGFTKVTARRTSEGPELPVSSSGSSKDD